jgi:acyl-CoA synthetase (AMP-forming)/AMP-acid ligase II
MNRWGFVWAPFAVGATNVPLARVTGEAVLESVERFGVTTLCAAPTVLRMILRAASGHEGRIPSAVRLATAGGAPAAATIQEIDERLGWHVTHLYGLTETTAFATHCEEPEALRSLAPDERARFQARQGIPLLLAGRARVTVVYRSLPPPDGALPADGVRTAPFDRLPELLREADGVVTAAKSAGRLLGPGPLADRLRPLPLVDLGVPRNVDPAVGTLPGIRLIDLEELFRTAPPVPDAGPGTERLLAEARAAAARLERVRPEAWVDALLRAAEAVRADEVARARPYLDGLSAAQQLAVDHVTRRIVARLLKRPIEDLRSLPPGTDGDAERDRRLRRSVPAGDRP